MRGVAEPDPAVQSWLVAVVLGLIAAACCAMPQAHAAPGDIAVSATVNGRDAVTATSGDPLRLSPDESVNIVIDMVNHGTRPVAVGQVEFAGRVLGLNFFSYATLVHVTVPPASRQTLRYSIDLAGLRGQATGLIGADVVIKDTAGHAIATIPTVTDVRGSLLSVYGLFGIALMVFTVLALVDVAIALARHRLSANRWKRGMRLLVPGLGIGLVIAFSASVLRLWVPETGLWLVVSGLTAVAFFAVGYFSPSPDGEDDEFDEDEEEALALSELFFDDFSADGVSR